MMNLMPLYVGSLENIFFLNTGEAAIYGDRAIYEGLHKTLSNV